MAKFNVRDRYCAVVAGLMHGRGLFDGQPVPDGKRTNPDVLAWLTTKQSQYERLPDTERANKTFEQWMEQGDERN